MEHHVNLVHNIPFFSVFFAMFCGIITPLLKADVRHAICMALW